MPPSTDALHQHFRRVAYQSGHVWINTIYKYPDPVSPTNWGWQQTGSKTLLTLRQLWDSLYHDSHDFDQLT